MSQSRLRTVPASLAAANDYTATLHRHNGPLPAAKFCVAVVDETDRVCGVAIAGLPKARMLNDGGTLEVSRVCTDGTPNACSALYGACKRAAKALGYWRVVTYTLASETGASLRASGWRQASEVKGESWGRRNATRNPTYRDAHDTGDKWRWEIELADPVAASWPEITDDQHALDFGGVA